MKILLFFLSMLLITSLTSAQEQTYVGRTPAAPINGNGFLYLLKLNDHVLMFTNAQGKLLVGNEDSSYTLNGAQ